MFVRQFMVFFVVWDVLYGVIDVVCVWWGQMVDPNGSEGRPEWDVEAL